MNDADDLIPLFFGEFMPELPGKIPVIDANNFSNLPKFHSTRAGLSPDLHVAQNDAPPKFVVAIL